MGTNDTKMGWKCHGDGDSTALQPYIKPTATWLSPQCTKQRVLKFGLGTNKCPSPPNPKKTSFMWEWRGYSTWCSN